VTGRSPISTLGLFPPSQPTAHTTTPQLPRVSTMEAGFQRPKERKGTVSSLNVAIDTVNLAKEISGIPLAKTAFDSVNALLTMIRVRRLLVYNRMFRLHNRQDSMMNELDYIGLGLDCADICRALGRGIKGKKLGELGQSVCDAINQLIA